MTLVSLTKASASSWVANFYEWHQEILELVLYMQPMSCRFQVCVLGEQRRTTVFV